MKPAIYALVPCALAFSTGMAHAERTGRAPIAAAAMAASPRALAAAGVTMRGKGHVVAGAAGGTLHAAMAQAPVGAKAGAITGTIHIRRADGTVVPVTLAAAWDYGR